MRNHSQAQGSPEELVKRWLKTVVIDLNLCPFAKKEFHGETIRFKVCSEISDETLLMTLATELSVLESNKLIETSLLIIENHLVDFANYCDFLVLAENLLEQLELDGVYQLASFHPRYQFANTQTDSAENYTNRSPYPLLHILREASVTRAVKSHPNMGSIPAKNIALMNQFDSDELATLFAGFTPD